MTSKGKYHLLPEEAGRASIDSEVNEDRPFIHSPSNSSPRNNNIGFTNFHPTFFLRLITFILHLAAVIVIGTQLHAVYYYNRDNAVPSIVFLSFSLARNFYVMFQHLLSKVVEISFSLQFSGMGKAKSGSELMVWLKRRVVPLVIDGTILLSLFIALPIGMKENRWGSTAIQQNGYAVALSAMPLYFFAIFDFGMPSSIAMSVHMKLVRKKVHEEPDTSRLQHEDVEALLPEDTEEIEEAGISV